jgi:hypothetical protein
MAETKSSALRSEIRSAFATAGLQNVNDDMLSKCRSCALFPLVLFRWY